MEGSASIPNDSAVLRRSQTPANARPTPEASGSGKLHVEWTRWEVFAAAYSFFFLFAHKFHLLQHSVLAAAKGNRILPVMKKLINIHLPGNVIGHELYMNMCSGGQTVSLCV